jgi:hypothetical protein
MLRSLHILLAVALAGMGGAEKPSYKGPNSLGPFRIDKDISMKSLFERLGTPSSAAGNVFCYRAKDERAFLVLTRMAEAYDSKIAGGALLSDFRNCVDRSSQVTPDDLAAWKTEQGVGLGSTAEDARKAYGKPSKEDKVGGTSYRWVIHGDFNSNHYRNEKRPEIGDTVLVYQGASDDLSTAEFGIRDGQVVWIFVSKNE